MAVIPFVLAILLARSNLWPKHQAILVTLLISVSLIMWFLAGRGLERYRQWILKNGTPAQALILEVRSRDSSPSDGRSRARLVLEVRPEDRAPYRAEVNLWVGVGDPKLVFHEGSTVRVFLDPNDPNHVEVPDPDRLLVP